MTYGRSDPLVAIHSMGKVGSSTLYRPVKNLIGDRAFHIHQLNAKTIEHAIKSGIGIVDHIKDSFRFLEARDRADRVKLVVPVREPLSRNVSAFFNNLTRFGIDEQTSDVDLVIRTFLERYPHHIPIRWFDLQVKQPLGIDPYEAKAGTPHVFANTKYELLVVRVEDSDSRIESQLQEYLDNPSISLQRENVGDQKSYKDLYGSFRSTFRPPKSLIQTLYEAEYVKAFYPENEVAHMRSFWEQRAS